MIADGRDEADDDHHDHDLDQREAARERARRGTHMAYWSRFQLPMSAFAPSPPS